MTIDPEMGLWTPNTLIRRYGHDLALTASALLNAYDNIHGTDGPQVLVPIETMLLSLGMDDTPECRAKLRQLVMRVGAKERVGARVEHGVVSLWLSPELQERARAYPRVELAAAA